MGMLSGLQRILKTVSLEEPDRVPHFEFDINNKVAEVLLPGSTYEDRIEYFDWDAVGIDDRYTKVWRGKQIDERHFIDQWGTTRRIGDERLSHPVKPAINNENDLETWKPPDPDRDDRFIELKKLVERYKGEKAIMAAFADSFNVANDILGAENHFAGFILNPQQIDRLSTLIRDYYIRYINNCYEIGVDIIFIKGDYASTTGPLVSPMHFEGHVIPILESLVREAKRHKLLVFKHTDGNINMLMDMILKTGIDGLHPIDLSAGMDLRETKIKYGEKICLMGNVDCQYVLSYGTKADVRKDVQRCINDAAKGGGFICMSSNSIHSGVKPENYLEMVKTIKELGKYPI